MFLNKKCFLFVFFFSSRRRHTRYWRDWSSDVCSSDLRLESGLTMEDSAGFWLIWASDRKSTRLNSSHANISYAVFCLKKKKKKKTTIVKKTQKQYKEPTDNTAEEKPP